MNLDPTFGTDIQKDGPALVVSPDDTDTALPRVIVAPITSSAGQPLGCRPELVFQVKNARTLLDQIHGVDRQRLGQKMGRIEAAFWHSVLLEMLA